MRIVWRPAALSLVLSLVVPAMLASGPAPAEAAPRGGASAGASPGRAGMLPPRPGPRVGKVDRTGAWRPGRPGHDRGHDRGRRGWTSVGAPAWGWWGGSYGPYYGPYGGFPVWPGDGVAAVDPDPSRGSAVQPGAFGNVTREPGRPVIFEVARKGGGLKVCRRFDGAKARGSRGEMLPLIVRMC
jgi:hypothetical protein